MNGNWGGEGRNGGSTSRWLVILIITEIDFKGKG